MADARILHRSAGSSAKVSALGDLEYRVWTQYILSADDFGVLPASPKAFQAENLNLHDRPARKVTAAIEAIVGITLLALFEHQSQSYLWQYDWQDWQGIRYPRATVRPIPSLADRQLATPKTRDLFQNHPSILRESSRKISENLPIPVRAGARETLPLTLTPSSHQPTQEKTGTPIDLQRLWNAVTTPPIARCRELTDQRRIRAAARLKERPWSEWEQIIARIQASGFCHGQNDRAWVASFDWLLQSEVATKVLEGKYDNRTPARQLTAEFRANGPAFDWLRECEERHGNACKTAHQHSDRLEREAAEESAAVDR